MWRQLSKRPTPCPMAQKATTGTPERGEASSKKVAALFTASDLSLAIRPFASLSRFVPPFRLFQGLGMLGALSAGAGPRKLDTIWHRHARRL